jgi:hypothetical protein
VTVDTSSPGERFLSALLAIANVPEASIQALESEFAETLLAFGSKTEDNVACVDRIGIRERSLSDYGRIIGLALKSNGIPVSDVLNFAEGSTVPEEVLQRFPQLEPEDWDAVLRLSTLVFSALEARLIKIDNASETH